MPPTITGAERPQLHHDIWKHVSQSLIHRANLKGTYTVVGNSNANGVHHSETMLTISHNCRIQNGISSDAEFVIRLMYMTNTKSHMATKPE